MEAVSPLAVEGALEAAQLVIRADDDVRRATKRDLEHVRYEASLASRRYETVDPAKRLVARLKDEVAMTVHWVGGRHTEIRLARARTSRYPEDRHPSPVEMIRTLGGYRADRQPAVTMNRMRCKRNDGESWTTLRVRALRERLGVPAFDPAVTGPETISVVETARRLKTEDMCGIYTSVQHELRRIWASHANQDYPSQLRPCGLSLFPIGSNGKKDASKRASSR
jgi:hypothetical protein